MGVEADIGRAVNFSAGPPGCKRGVLPMNRYHGVFLIFLLWDGAV